jgi:predicted membrane channel-forming protein YqfA (hemolysin III family)
MGHGGDLGAAHNRQMTERDQTLGEEIANAASHGVALLAALATVPFLVIAASHRHPSAVVGAAVFGATMVLLYLASTLYHALPAGRAKCVFNKLDHSAIYLFIAGSYTPFALGALDGPWGWTLFGVVWFGRWLPLAWRSRPLTASRTPGGPPVCTWPWAGWCWWPPCPCSSACP